jgi:hypothetical protein
MGQNEAALTRREGGEVGTNYRGSITLYVFVFVDGIIICRLYKLTFSDQAQVTLQMRVSRFYLV